jgi:hypothetical protein
MIASIFRSDLGDCSNKGVSSRASKVCVINVEGPFDPNDETPAVRLVKRRSGNVVAIPVGLDEHAVMFGGTYVSTSDARFNRAVEQMSGYGTGFPVALHDRVER